MTPTANTAALAGHESGQTSAQFEPIANGTVGSGGTCNDPQNGRDLSGDVRGRVCCGLGSGQIRRVERLMRSALRYGWLSRPERKTGDRGTG